MGGCGVINYAPLFTMFIVQQVYSTLGIYLIKNYEEVQTALMFYFFLSCTNDIKQSVSSLKFENQYNDLTNKKNRSFTHRKIFRTF